MRALMLEPPEELLAERHRKGADRRDEVWDGVLHMVPPPTGLHQWAASHLYDALGPIARGQGLEITYETGLFRAGTGDRDYRVPDIAIFRPENFSLERGLEGRAELVVEVLSPGDESREKFGFYATCGIAEVLLVEPKTREFELYVLRSSSYFILKDEHGAAHSSVLGVTFSRVDGPKLRVSTSSGFTDV